jgi:hypothetical protein
MRAVFLAPEEEVRVHIQHAATKDGGLRVLVGTASNRERPSMRSDVDPGSVDSPPRDLASIIAPIVRGVEAASEHVCAFCGRSDEVRVGERTALPLCERHARYGPYDLRASWEIMTDPATAPRPPDLETAVAALEENKAVFAAWGAVAIGLLPPRGPVDPYLIAFDLVPDRSAIAEHMIQRWAQDLIGWRVVENFSAPSGAADPSIHWICVRENH